MSITRLLAAAALTCGPVSAKAWLDSARQLPATDAIGFSQPGGHPGDFFTLDIPHLVKPGEVSMRYDGLDGQGRST